MGGTIVSHRAMVTSGGYAYRMKDSLIRHEFRHSVPMQQVLLSYTQALLTQMAQSAVCNRHHSLDQQLCRWLLMSLDRHTSNILLTTQEMISNMLGVRREGVTESAGKLQAAGVISYRRGQITVLDRIGLEQKCCECYRVVRNEFDRLLPEPPHRRLSSA
jgi:CRP-like cAMP-binding protein